MQSTLIMILLVTIEWANISDQQNPRMNKPPRSKSLSLTLASEQPAQLAIQPIAQVPVSIPPDIIPFIFIFVTYILLLIRNLHAAHVNKFANFSFISA